MKKAFLFLSVVILAALMATVCVAADSIAWPGDNEVYSSELSFKKNSSGLDFHDGKLYTVDNGDGLVYILNVDKEGNISFADGAENGISLAYKTKPFNSVPDAEGISIDENGFAYIATERENGGSESCNMILKVDLSKTPDEDNTIQADIDWDITDYLPNVDKNSGIEAVEWISFEDVNGKIVDVNTDELFDSARYPNSDSNGMLFVALEDNGHVYGFVCNSDSSVELICDIPSGFNGAMALDYDKYEDALWVVTDDTYSNMAVKMTFNGTKTPDLQKIDPPAELDVTKNNEGFAIADHTYTVNGKRPVYRITDGPSQALKIGSIDCDYVEHVCENYEWVIVKEASCANGIKEKRCVECGAVKETETVPSLYGHNNNSQVIYGSRINAEGKKELYCQECDLVIDIDATNIDLVFEDTAAKTWYGDAVGYIYTLGYMGSTSQTKYTFEPNTSTTRAMFVTILGRIKGIDIAEYENKTSSFTDVTAGQWYTPYVIWAYENGVVMGYPNGSFGVTDTITREQIVSILFRISAPEGSVDTSVLNTYTDVKTISSYAVDAFAWAVDNRIVNGTSKTTLAPKKNASRAEIAQVILNYLDSGLA